MRKLGFLLVCAAALGLFHTPALLVQDDVEEARADFIETDPERALASLMAAGNATGICPELESPATDLILTPAKQPFSASSTIVTGPAIHLTVAR